MVAMHGNFASLDSVRKLVDIVACMRSLQGFLAHFSQMVYVTSLIVWPVLEDEEAIKKQNKEKFLHWMVFLVYTILMSGCVAVVLFWNFYYPATSVSYKAMDNALGIISSVCMMAYLAPQVCRTEVTTHCVRFTQPGPSKVFLVVTEI